MNTLERKKLLCFGIYLQYANKRNSKNSKISLIYAKQTKRENYFTFLNPLKNMYFDLHQVLYNNKKRKDRKI